MRTAAHRYEDKFYEFCYEILGYTDMNEEHKKLCSFLVNPWKSKLVMMPRYTFKSCICTVGYSMFRHIRNPNLRILIYSDATSKAQGFLTSIKNHILGKAKGSKFRYWFGEWETNPKDEVGKWNESEIIIKMRSDAQAEPSIETAGIETSLTGRHYDIIIFDDIVSDKNVTTKEQMDKTAECYKKALSLLKPTGEVIMVGTRWHFGDLYGRLIEENRQGKIFDVFHRNSGYNDGKLLFDNLGESSLSWEFLEQQRNLQGSYIFSCLYENQPVDPETAVFKARDFSFYGAVKPDDLYITCACDPAGEGQDYTAITVVGTDNNMDMHILDIVNEHLQPNEIINRIINLNYKYKFKRFGIETNFFRGTLHQSLQMRINEERKENPDLFNLFGVEEFKATSRKGEGKNNRIMGLQPYHERGAIKFPGDKVEGLARGFNDLAYQMIQFPHSKHDDILDSLAYHLPLIRKGGVVKSEGPPRLTPAWLEQKALDEEIGRINSLPRRFRPSIDSRLAFN